MFVQNVYRVDCMPNRYLIHLDSKKKHEFLYTEVIRKEWYLQQNFFLKKSEVSIDA